MPVGDMKSLMMFRYLRVDVLVAQLRSLGLDVPCERIKFLDRDEKPCRPGVYSLTSTDRRKVYQWLAKRSTGGTNE